MKASSPIDQAQRLIDHARAVAQEIYKFSVELTESNETVAQQKLNYGKQVLNSLEGLPKKYLSSQDGGKEFLDLIYLNYISVKPTLVNAISDLQARIEQKAYFKLPEDIMNENELLEKLMRNSDETDSDDSSSSSDSSEDEEEEEEEEADDEEAQNQNQNETQNDNDNENEKENEK